jgi:hypothetical protein
MMSVAATAPACTLAAPPAPPPPLAGTTSWSRATKTFDPGASLVAGHDYVATVGTGARDVAGNALAASYSWQFRASSTTTGSPSTTTVETGSLRGGAASSLAADDNQYFQVTSTSFGTRTTSWYATTPGVPNEATSLHVTYRGSNSRTCTQSTSIWNWSTSSWTTLDTRSVGSSEVQLTNLAPSGSPATWVSGAAGTGDVRVRVRCTRSSSSSFVANGDLLRLSWE